VGKAMREFRKATSELTNEVTNAAQATPPPPAAPQPAPPAVETSTATGSQSEAKS